MFQKALAHRHIDAVLVIQVFAIGATAAGSAQGPDPLTFDVASVRISAAVADSSQRVTDSRVDIIGQSLRSVLLLAFRAKDYQLSAPGWLQDVKVDIQATVPAGARRQQVPEMLQDLLSKRFSLLAHRELRPLQAYELLVDTSGVKMEQVEPLNELDGVFPTNPAFTTPADRARADRLVETPDGPVRTVLGDLSRTIVTARSMYEVKLTDRRTQILNATRMSMGDLALLLERVTGQPILDKTNLSALYKFTIELPPDERARDIVMRSGINLSDVTSLAVPAATLTSEAVKKLGLRLERRRSQIETIVVDRLERAPLEN